MTQMLTAKKNFIKVIDQKLAETLIASGFSYIKEGEFYAFAETPEILSVLQRAEFSEAVVIAENKLKF